MSEEDQIRMLDQFVTSTELNYLSGITVEPQNIVAGSTFRGTGGTLIGSTTTNILNPILYTTNTYVVQQSGITTTLPNNQPLTSFIIEEEPSYNFFTACTIIKE